MPAPRRAPLSLAPLLVFALAGAPLSGYDGELDADGFAPPNGFVTLGSTTTAGRAGLVGPDGSAVLIGQAATNGIFWARVGENGGGGGTCTFTPPGVGAAGAYHGLFDRDGRLVLTGAATYPALGTVLFVARFLYPDCTLDSAFDGDGYFTLDGAADLIGLRVAATRVASPLPGIWFERLVVAGNEYVQNGSDLSDIVLVRLREDGSLDSGFGGGDGVVRLDFDGETNLVAALAVDTARRLVVAGNVDPFGADPDAMILRTLPDGTLDGSFGSFGWTRWDCGTTNPGEDQVGALAIAPGGELYVASVWIYEVPATVSYVMATQLSADGVVGDSELLLNLGPGSITADGLALQGDGRLILVGSTDALASDWRGWALAVRVPGWEADPTWGNPSDLIEYDLDLVAGGNERLAAVALAAGRPLVFGHADTPSGLRGLVLRLDNAYIFADGFEAGSTASW